MEIKSLHICGEPVGDRFNVEINGTPLALTANSFLLLAQLAHARKQGIDDGWVAKEKLKPGFNHSRYLYRLRKEISSEPKTLRSFIKNLRGGRYRLGIPPGKIRINYRALLKHYDISVRQLADGKGF